MSGRPGESPEPRLPEGKVPWEVIERHLAGDLPPGVLLGPARGEDAALVEIGGQVWAVASDPITFTAWNAGRLAVLVNANDVAVRGARPTFFVAVLLLAPAEATSCQVEAIFAQIRGTCRELGASLIGGHTEVTPGLAHSVVVGTMLGPVTGRAITTGGLREGDWVGLTKWAGLEGTAILLSELGDRLRELWGPEDVRTLREIFPGEWLSVVPEARVAAESPGVSALHDVTEGGVGEALFELAQASAVGLEVNREDVPLLPETRRLCRDLGIDPLGLIGSGALLVGCSEEGRLPLARAFAKREIPFSWIGRAVPSERAGAGPPRFVRDEILKARLLEGIEAILFDMDGTLVDSSYDWPAIRQRLGVTGPSIIDHLNGLDGPEREEGWKVLQGIEAEATRRARIKPETSELLAFLRDRGVPVALVTNNSEENTRFLVERHELSFETVVTRDSGYWKPSGAPLREAARRLGVPVERCLAVGDSAYDVLAARDARCARVIVVHSPPPSRPAITRSETGPDLTLADLGALRRYLHLIL